MLALAVFTGILAVILAIGLIRVGILMIYADEELALYIAVGPIRKQILPEKSSKKREKNQKNEQNLAAKPQKKEKAALSKSEWSDIRAAAGALWPVIKRALRRVRKGIRLDPLELHITFGGRDDPAAAAEHYGGANAAIWTLMPALEQLLQIRNPSVGAALDFESSQTKARAKVCITMRIGAMVLLGLQTGIPAVRWFLEYRKQKRQQTIKKAKPVRQAPAA